MVAITAAALVGAIVAAATVTTQVGSATTVWEGRFDERSRSASYTAYAAALETVVPAR